MRQRKDQRKSLPRPVLNCGRPPLQPRPRNFLAFNRGFVPSILATAAVHLFYLQPPRIFPAEKRPNARRRNFAPRQPPCGNRERGQAEINTENRKKQTAARRTGPRKRAEKSAPNNMFGALIPFNYRGTGAKLRNGIRNRHPRRFPHPRRRPHRLQSRRDLPPYIQSHRRRERFPFLRPPRIRRRILRHRNHR